MDEQPHDDVRWCPPQMDLRLARECMLPEPHGRRIRQHTRTCKACQERRTRDDDLFALLRQAVIAEDDPVLAITAQRMERFKPPSPEHRANFYQQLQDLRQTQARHVAAMTIGNVVARRWLAAASAAIVLVATDVLPRATVTKERPEELLTRAAVHGRVRPDGWRQRIRVSFAPPVVFAATRTTFAPARPFTSIDEIGTGPIFSGRPIRSLAELPPEVIQTLDHHHFDWQDPLSIEFLKSWRAAPPMKRDHVTWMGRRARTVLRTTSPHGLLREVRLTMVPQTHRVVAQTFVFAGFGRLEIEEISNWVVPAPEPLIFPLRGLTVEATALHPDALIFAEITARLLLRLEDADLSDDLHIERTNTGVRVQGSFSPRVVARLEAVRHVDVVPGTIPDDAGGMGPDDAWTSEAATIGDEAMSAGTIEPRPASAGAHGTEFVRRLDTRFNERVAERDAFAAEFLGSLSRVTRRLRALQTLARQYPDSKTHALTPETGSRFRELVGLHYDAIRAELFRFYPKVSALYGPRSLSRVTPRVPSNWRSRAEDGLVCARQLDGLLRHSPAQNPRVDDSKVSGTEDLDDSGDPVSVEFDRLWESLNARAR